MDYTDHIRELIETSEKSDLENGYFFLYGVLAGQLRVNGVADFEGASFNFIKTALSKDDPRPVLSIPENISEIDFTNIMEDIMADIGTIPLQPSHGPKEQRCEHEPSQHSGAPLRPVTVYCHECETYCFSVDDCILYEGAPTLYDETEIPTLRKYVYIKYRDNRDFNDKQLIHMRMGYDVSNFEDKGDYLGVLWQYDALNTVLNQG